MSADCRTLFHRVLLSGALLLAFSAFTGCEEDSSSGLLPGECRSTSHCASDEICVEGFCEYVEPEPCGGLCTSDEVCNEALDTCEPRVSSDVDGDDAAEDADSDDANGGDGQNGDDTFTPPVEEVCEPACSPNQLCRDGQCIDLNCEMEAHDCTSDATPYLDRELCRCVACLGPDDCGSGEVCANNGRCVAPVSPDATCQSRSDCGQDYCSNGYCVECISSDECGAGNICARGACKTCGELCEADEICTPQGTCVDASVADGTCTTASDCIEGAHILGYNGDPALLGCDPVLGCYVMGACNSGTAGDQQPDPYAGACGSGSTCEKTGDLFGDLLGGDMGDFGDMFGDMFDGMLPGMEAGFTCSCENNENACRLGETCRESGGFMGLPIPGMGGAKSCQPPGGGGDGGMFDDFPFPF